MYIADLHIHSKYSRATSKDLEPEQLAAWAARKGIGLVGTGDFTHPAWRAELQDKLVEEEEGVYTLKGAGADAPALWSPERSARSTKRTTRCARFTA